MSRTRLSAVLAALLLTLIGLTAVTAPAGAAPAPGPTTLAPPTPLGTPSTPPDRTATPPTAGTTSPWPGATTGAPPPYNDGQPPPRAVSDLQVTALTPRSVTLSWSPALATCCGVAGYEFTIFERFNDAIRLQAVGNVTSYTFGVNPTHEYTYRMVAFDSAGRRSAYSNSVSVVVPFASAGDVTPPSAPTGLQLTGTTLSWVGSTDDLGVTGYNVYVFDGLYISTLAATVTGTSAPLSAVQGGGVRFAYVRARDAAGNLSAASTTVTVPVTTSQPPPPSTCRVAYTVSSHWASGFVAEVAVTNAGAAPVTGWSLLLRYGGDQKVSQAWGADFTQNGTEVTLTGLSWNRDIPAGGTVRPGLLGTGSAGADKPVSAVLNGMPCLIG